MWHWLIAGISWNFLSKLAIDTLRGKLSLNEVSRFFGSNPSQNTQIVTIPSALSRYSNM